MSAPQIIEEFKALSPEERAKVTKFVVENDDSWIPDEFKEAMQDAEAGRLVDMGTALNETPDAWRDETRRRLAELESGKVQAVPGDVVSERIRKIVGR